MSDLVEGLLLRRGDPAAETPGVRHRHHPPEDAGDLVLQPRHLRRVDRLTLLVGVDAPLPEAFLDLLASAGSPLIYRLPRLLDLRFAGVGPARLAHRNTRVIRK